MPLCALELLQLLVYIVTLRVLYMYFFYKPGCTFYNKITSTATLPQANGAADPLQVTSMPSGERSLNGITSHMIRQQQQVQIDQLDGVQYHVQPCKLRVNLFQVNFIVSLYI